MHTINGHTIAELVELADAAFKKASEKVIAIAIQTNTPIVIWHDGAIKEIPATPGMTLESFASLVNGRAS